MRVRAFFASVPLPLPATHERLLIGVAGRGTAPVPRVFEQTARQSLGGRFDANRVARVRPGQGFGRQIELVSGRGRAHLGITMRFLLIAGLLGLFGGPSFAGVDEGREAFENGEYELAINELSPTTQADDPDAQYWLGRVHDAKGEADTAFQWFSKAAAAGHDDSQRVLGIYYEEGKSVDQDFALAAQWYRAAAEQGNAKAQRNLGTFYANGRGVSLDYTEARRWYQAAADQGNAKAMRNLAYMSYFGEGVRSDFGRAAELFAAASGVGLGKAQYDLGRLYYRGQVVRAGSTGGLRQLRGGRRARTRQGADISGPNVFQGRGDSPGRCRSLSLVQHCSSSGAETRGKIPRSSFGPHER